MMVCVALCASSAVAQTEPSPAAAKQTTYTLEPVVSASAEYPAEAREQHIEGNVTTWILVSRTGEVEYVKVDNAEPALAKSAEDAARKLKFKPILKDGKPAQMVARVSYNFTSTSEGRFPPEIVPEIAPAVDAPSMVRLWKERPEGLLLNQVTPIYPAKARKKHIEGVVVVRAMIGTDGVVHDLTLVSGPPMLVDAAMDALRQWRYRPYMFMGQPVEVEVKVEVKFALGRK
jgi:TonB family protein